MTGEELRQWRIEAGYKQEDLATELGVSRPTLSAWENRKSKPIDRLVWLAVNALQANPMLRMSYKDGVGPPEKANDVR